MSDNDYYIYPSLNKGLDFPPAVQERIARILAFEKYYAHIDPDTGELQIDGKSVVPAYTGDIPALEAIWGSLSSKLIAGFKSDEDPLGLAFKQVTGKYALTSGSETNTTFVAGTLIANADGTWALSSSAELRQRGINIDSVEPIKAFEDGSGVDLRVNYSSIDGARSVAFALGTSSLAGLGYIPSIRHNEDSATIRFTQDMPEYNGYVYYDALDRAWKSSNFLINPSFSGGRLRLDYLGSIPEAAKDYLSVTPRGNFYRYNVDTDTSPTSTKSLLLEVRENEPSIASYIQFNGLKWTSSDGRFVINNWDSNTGELTLTHTDLLPASADRISLASRGSYDIHVASSDGALSRGRTVLEFWNNGVLAKGAPNTGFKFYIQRGGSTGLAPEPSGDMKVFIRHGGGDRYVGADEVAREIPNATISLIGIIDKD